MNKLMSLDNVRIFVMQKIGRYNLSEISLNRLFSALLLRGKEIPQDLSWKFSQFSPANSAKIRNYKGIHEGERCFIVANGPSLQKTNLDLLAHEKTIGMNRIYLNFDKTSFRPTYFTAVNELILEQFAGEISNLTMPKFLNWNRRNNYDTNDSSNIFLKSKMVINDTFQKDIAKPLVVGGTVTFVALQIAFYMGFSKVVIIGLDHKYAEKGTPNKTEIRTTSA